MAVTVKQFGEIDGEVISEYTLKNKDGLEIACINYGCILTRIMAPDRFGKFENIVLGYDDLGSYLRNPAYFGAVVGRIAGRIKNAEFELNDKTYRLLKNDGRNHLHGGPKGLAHSVWKFETIEKKDESGVLFRYRSPDGEDGFPGNLEVDVIYTLTDNNEFSIHYKAKSDKDTIFNPTNHTYFNLTGDLKNNVLQHTLTAKCDKYLELNEQTLPTGKMVDVSHTVFDFRQGRTIGSGVTSKEKQIQLAKGGYDHPFVLSEHFNKEILLSEPESGRSLVIETDAVGFVLYTGNNLSEKDKVYSTHARQFGGLCIETQGLPDAVHQPEFPSIVLKAKDNFASRTIFRFGTIGR